MKSLPNGSLPNLIAKGKKIEENDTKTRFLQLVSSFYYLHNEKHIVHGDLKGQNILFDKYYDIQVIDFGLSTTFQSNNSMLYTICRSFVSIPPEMISGQSYNVKSDILSVAILLYHLVCGKLPFRRKSQKVIFDQIQNHKSNESEISSDLTNLIHQLLKKNPDERVFLHIIQKHPCFLLIYYNQLLNSSLEQAMKLYHENLIGNSIKNMSLSQNLLIENHILIKEKITVHLRCLNQIEFQVKRCRSSMRKHQFLSRIKSRQNIIFRMFSELSALLVQEKKLLWAVRHSS
jgi:serine/threonine protein kinase